MPSSRFPLLNFRVCLSALAFLSLAFAVISPFTRAHGAPAKVRKQTTTITIKESEGTDDENEKPVETDHRTEDVENTKTATFGARGQTGLAGCKTDDVLKSAVKDLKADCRAWINDQKKELKSRFLTSSCEELCDDCGMSLRRCHVLGTISYKVPGTFCRSDAPDGCR